MFTLYGCIPNSSGLEINVGAVQPTSIRLQLQLLTG